MFRAKNVPLKVVSTINSLVLLVENYVGTVQLYTANYKIGWNLVIQNRQSENRIKPSAPYPSLTFLSEICVKCRTQTQQTHSVF